jgi:hypothetical protein
MFKVDPPVQLMDELEQVAHTGPCQYAVTWGVQIEFKKRLFFVTAAVFAWQASVTAN